MIVSANKYNFGTHTIPAKFHFRVAKFTSEFSTDYFRSAILFSISVHWKSMVSSNVQSHLPWIYGDQITQSTSKFATIPFISFATGFLHKEVYFRETNFIPWLYYTNKLQVCTMYAWYISIFDYAKKLISSWGTRNTKNSYFFHFCLFVKLQFLDNFFFLNSRKTKSPTRSGLSRVKFATTHE